MARLVVLRFEDDEDAEDFIGYIGRDATSLGYMYKDFTAEGMFQTPTKFHGDHASSGWRYSEKHGWWICRDCGAPSVGYGENIKAVIFDAKNLLERPSKNTLERIPTDPKVNPETGERRERSNNDDPPNNSNDSELSGADGKRFSLMDDGAYDSRYPFHHGRVVTEVSLPADASMDVSENVREDIPVRDKDRQESNLAGDAELGSRADSRDTKDRGSSPVVAWPADRDG